MSIDYVPGTEPEPREAFDWHHDDIINRPPYSHYDMVIALAEGRFSIEGEQSTFSDAVLYADRHNTEPDVFKALDDWENGINLAIEGPLSV